MASLNGLVLAFCAYQASADSSLDKDINVSFKQCLQKCKAWKECYVVEYFSLFKMCNYFKTVEDSCAQDSNNCGPKNNVQYYIKPNDWRYTDSELEEKVCPEPPKIPEARIFGNLRKIGSKVKYTCNKNSSLVYIIQCLSDSTWSIPQESFKCPVGCREPEFQDYQRVRINGSVERVNETHYSVSLACVEDDIEIRPIRTLYCDVFEGFWQYQEYVCCRVFQNINEGLPKYLVYEISSYSKRIQTVQLDGGYVIGEKCFYKNGTFWRNDSDTSIVINKVVVNVKNSTKAVHQFKFCKSHSNSLSNSWFSSESLCYWFIDDVKVPNDTKGNTYFYMNTSWIDPFVQFHVTSEENGQPCSSPSWLTVTDNTMECYHGNSSSIRVLYAKNNAKLFNDSGVEEAAVLKVWAYCDDLSV